MTMYGTNDLAVLIQMYQLGRNANTKPQQYQQGWNNPMGNIGNIQAYSGQPLLPQRDENCNALAHTFQQNGGQQQLRGQNFRRLSQYQNGGGGQHRGSGNRNNSRSPPHQQQQHVVGPQRTAPTNNNRTSTAPYDRRSPGQQQQPLSNTTNTTTTIPTAAGVGALPQPLPGFPKPEGTLNTLLFLTGHLYCAALQLVPKHKLPAQAQVTDSLRLWSRLSAIADGKDTAKLVGNLADLIYVIVNLHEHRVRPRDPTIIALLAEAETLLESEEVGKNLMARENPQLTCEKYATATKGWRYHVWVGLLELYIVVLNIAGETLLIERDNLARERARRARELEVEKREREMQRAREEWTRTAKIQGRQCVDEREE